MTTNSLNQSQRESLINILVLGMYSDGHLSLLEDESLNSFLESLGWDSGTGRTVFLTDSISQVTRITNDIDFTHFIDSNASSFDSEESRTFALDSLTKFLKVDGISATEAPFLAKVRLALKA